MIILLDTSTPVCRFGVVQDEKTIWHEWEANRELSKGLLRYIVTTLASYDAQLSDITGIGVMRGPGSFTGLRIGLTVVNTLADGLQIPIVGAQGDAWSAEAVSKLRAGENDTMVMPEYGSDAHITKPRK